MVQKVIQAKRRGKNKARKARQKGGGAWYMAGQVRVILYGVIMAKKGKSKKGQKMAGGGPDSQVRKAGGKK